MCLPIKYRLLILGILLVAITPVMGGKIFRGIRSVFSSNARAASEPEKSASSPGLPATPEQRQKFQRELQRRPQNIKDIAEAKSHYLTGLKCFQNGDHKAAEKEWRIATKLDPNNPDVKKGLIRITELVTNTGK